MSKEEVMKSLEDLYDAYSTIAEQILDVRQDIELNGEFGAPEREKLADLRNAFDDAAHNLGNLLRGVII